MGESRIEKVLAAFMPFPMCIVNSKGKVKLANSKIDEVFIYDQIKGADIYALTGFKFTEIKNKSTSKGFLLPRNDRVFRISASPIGEDENESTLIVFLDVTNYEALKTLYNDEKICMAIVSVDNVDELYSNTAEDKRSALFTGIDKTVRKWAAKINASVTRYKDYVYMIVMGNSDCETLVETKFTILDEIREVETETDFPVTLSIGIGVGGKTPAKTAESAQAALDLALGRGGDQAVIKRGSKIEYFGGKMQTVEKSNKGKSRIMAHVIKQLMEQSSKVMIMGHVKPDMDAFGSALGIFRLAVNINKEAHIIINKIGDNLADIYEQAKKIEVYSFISSEKALATADKDTLVIVVDTHRQSLTECPGILDMTDKIIVIDHHRKAEECIENPTLAYMEPYASSTAELVTEILQYSKEEKNYTRFEAEALLAGITVDTNRFAGKAGVRTFEAASWLRRAGADTSAVKRFFQSDAQAFKIRANCIAKAEFLNNTIALSICEGMHPEMHIINAQAADILLEIKGIKASFVAGLDDEGFTVVSARSLGEINVQVIMEEFGGGGHLMTAGAQTELPPGEVISRIREKLSQTGER
jgi:c-di-AMP phosphodiesterase-like protein